MKESGITARGLVAGTLVAALIGAGAAYENLVVSGSTMNFDYSMGGALFALALLVLVVNPLLGLVRRSWPLGKGELATIHIMAMVACVLPTVGLVGWLIPAISAGSYYATPENNWLNTVLPHVKPWLTVEDPGVVRDFYEGMGGPIPWGAWARPLGYWALLLGSFFGAVLALAALVHRQWSVHERLLFPLLQVPIAMIGDPQNEGGQWASVFRKRLFWAGVGITGFFYSLRALHHYHPAVPEGLPIWWFLHLAGGAVVIPWTLNYAGVGFGYLLTTRLSFSIWFLGVLTIAEEAAFAHFGISSGERLWWNVSPTVYPAYQGLGAMLAFALLTLWSGRGYYRRLWALVRQGGEEEGEEVLSSRQAALLLAASLLGMGLWLGVAGLEWLYIPPLLAAIFLLMLGITRIVAEGGLATMVAPVVPSDVLITAVGSSALGPANLGVLGLMLPVASHMRTSMMAALVHGLKLAEIHVAGRRRRLVGAVALAIAASLGCAVGVMLVMGYQHGGINLSYWFFGPSGGATYDFISYHVNNNSLTRWDSLGFAGLGAGLQLLLTAAYHRFHWWPIHPLGFPIAAIWCTHQVMVSMFAAWLAKVLVLHYGGVRLYHASRPLFLGLILGQYLSGGIWLIVDWQTGMQNSYLFFW